MTYTPFDHCGLDEGSREVQSVGKIKQYSFSTVIDIRGHAYTLVMAQIQAVLESHIRKWRRWGRKYTYTAPLEQSFIHQLL